MFHGASAFNQDISKWDVRSGTDFVSALLLWLLECCSLWCFLVSISGHWNTVASHLAHACIVTYFKMGLNILPSQDEMFRGATTFNQDISKWDVSSGTSFVSALLLWLLECSSLCCFLSWARDIGILSILLFSCRVYGSLTLFQPALDDKLSGSCTNLYYACPVVSANKAN